ncbi:hypothetical protein [Petrachloros mirabilis]
MTSIIAVKSYNEDRKIGDFFDELNKCPNITSDFLCAKLDATSIKDILREYVAENGLSSLFHFTITCDSVLHPGLHVDDIEKVILSFIRRLEGAKNLFIIDPYFYSNDPSCVDLFGRLIETLSETLDTVTFITNGQNIEKKMAMHEVLRKGIPAIKIADIKTDQFHDRFWIDPDSMRGIVFGTSLNGIGKKIALVDKLSSSDVREIASLARQFL